MRRLIAIVPWDQYANDSNSKGDSRESSWSILAATAGSLNSVVQARACLKYTLVGYGWAPPACVDAAT